MGHRSVFIFELMLLGTILGRALAVIEAQEQSPSNENPPQMNSIGSISSPSKFAEMTAPGKSSRYIIRFARTPHSQIRFSRSPANQIRFGRSQSFVRFGRNNQLNDDNSSSSSSSKAANSRYNDKFIRFARNGIDNFYPSDDSIIVEPRGRDDNGFIRFGRR